MPQELLHFLGIDALVVLVVVVNRRGQTVETIYGALDRALVVYALTDTLSFAYDPADRWMSVKNRESVDTLRFDIAGHLTDAITRRGASGTIRSQVVSSWDNARDLRTRYEVHGHGSGARNFVYNEFHQLQSINGGGPYQDETVFGYNPRRLANSVKLPSWLEVFTNFPSTRRPGQISYSDATVDIALGLNYSHDKLSRVAERKRTSSDTISVHGYDGPGRLWYVTDYVDTEPVCSWNPTDGFVCNPAGAPARAAAHLSYDKVGNRNDSGAVINTGNRLSFYGAHSFDYDADGNLRRKYRTADPATFDQQLYWNALSQLDSVRTVRSGVPTTVRFGYDGFGRRVRKTTDAGTARFVYDGDNLILELDVRL